MLKRLLLFSLFVFSHQNTFAQVKDYFDEHSWSYLDSIYRHARNLQNGRDKIKLSEEIKLKANSLNEYQAEFYLGYAYLIKGRGYTKLGNLSEALIYHFKALDIFRKYNDLKGEANTLNTLSFIYSSQKDYRNALKCDLKSFAIYHQLNIKQKEAIATCNIGEGFYMLQQYDSAIFYTTKSLKLTQELDKKRLFYYNLGNIGLSHLKLQNLDSAYFHLNQSIAGLEKYNDNYALSFYTVGIGQYYLLNKEFKQAETWTLKGLALAKDAQLLEQTLDASKALAEIYQHFKQYEKAFSYEKQSSILQDSLLNLEKLQNLERLKVQKELEEKESTIKQLENEKQQIVKEGVSKAIIQGYGLTVLYQEYYVFLFLIILIISFTFSFAWRYWNSKFQTQEESKKYDVDKVMEYEQTINSMSQAGDFQQQVFPNKDILDNVANGCFVYFKPLEYISGDFYYVGECGDSKIVVVGDATGHGAQAGLISMLGISLLDEVVVRMKIDDPAEILEYLDRQFKDLLRSNVIADFNGMSLSIISYNENARYFKFAGAKHDLTIISKNSIGVPQIEHIKGSRRFVGDSSNHNMKAFESVIFFLEEDDNMMVYMYSDGFKDQLGGKENKKYNYKRFRDYLYKIHQYPMSEQQELLKSEMENWMSYTPFQVDDFLVMGINMGVKVEEIEIIQT